MNSDFRMIVRHEREQTEKTVVVAAEAVSRSFDLLKSIAVRWPLAETLHLRLQGPERGRLYRRGQYGRICTPLPWVATIESMQALEQWAEGLR